MKMRKPLQFPVPSHKTVFSTSSWWLNTVELASEHFQATVLKCVHSLWLAHWQSKFLACQAWGVFSAEQSCFFKSSDVPLEARKKKPYFCIITAFSRTKFTALWEITKQKALEWSPHCTDVWMREKNYLAQKSPRGLFGTVFLFPGLYSGSCKPE